MKTTRPWYAVYFILAAILLPCSVLPAQPFVKPRPPGEELWSLKISEKSFDPGTGQLDLYIENTNGSLAVTAFGVSAVVSRQDGSGSSQIFSRELLPGEPIGPAETKHLEINLSPATPGSGVSDIEGVKVDLYFEVRSDTSSVGDPTFAADILRARAHRAAVLEKAVERFDSTGARYKAMDSTVEFFKREARRGESARIALANPYRQIPLETRERLATGANIASLAKQAIAQSKTGGSPDGLFEDVRWILQADLETLRSHSLAQDMSTARNCRDFCMKDLIGASGRAEAAALSWDIDNP